MATKVGLFALVFFCLCAISGWCNVYSVTSIYLTIRPPCPFLPCLVTSYFVCQFLDGCLPIRLLVCVPVCLSACDYLSVIVHVRVVCVQDYLSVIVHVRVVCAYAYLPVTVHVCVVCVGTICLL